jgi:hypothetical protein
VLQFVTRLNVTLRYYHVFVFLFLSSIFYFLFFFFFFRDYSRSIFRFPNTQIRLLFESYLSRSKQSKDLNDNFVYIKTTSPSLKLNTNEINQQEKQQQQQQQIIDLGLIDTTDDSIDKPLYTYAQLIAQAILSSKEQQLTLNQIYAYISNRFPFYQLNDRGWQNSIRHNLSLNRFFIKIPRQHNDPGKGSFWKIHKEYQDSLAQQAFVHKRSRFFNCNNYSRSRSSTNDIRITSSNENEYSSESPINTNTNTSTSTSTNNNNNNNITNNNNNERENLNLNLNSNENKNQNEQMIFNPEMLITYLCKNVNNKRNNNNTKKESPNKDSISRNSDFTSSNKSQSNESSNDNQESSSNNGCYGESSTSSSSFANIFFAKLLKSVASGKFKSEEYSDNQPSFSKSTPSPPQSSSQISTSPKQDYNPSSNSSVSGSDDIESKKRKLSENSSGA